MIESVSTLVLYTIVVFFLGMLGGWLIRWEVYADPPEATPQSCPPQWHEADAAYAIKRPPRLTDERIMEMDKHITPGTDARHDKLILARAVQAARDQQWELEGALMKIDMQRKP